MLGSTRVSKPGLIIFYGECWIFFLNELIWAHMNSLELLWAHLNSHELPWTPLNSPELPWTPLNSPEFTWNPLNSPEFTWNSLNSPEIPWSHLNIIEFAWSFWIFFIFILKKWKAKPYVWISQHSFWAGKPELQTNMFTTSERNMLHGHSHRSCVCPS